jgi:hypothetical protein
MVLDSGDDAVGAGAAVATATAVGANDGLCSVLIADPPTGSVACGAVEAIASVAVVAGKAGFCRDFFSGLFGASLAELAIATPNDTDGDAFVEPARNSDTCSVRPDGAFDSSRTALEGIRNVAAWAYAEPGDAPNDGLAIEPIDVPENREGTLARAGRTACCVDEG